MAAGGEGIGEGEMGVRDRWGPRLEMKGGGQRNGSEANLACPVLQVRLL